MADNEPFTDSQGHSSYNAGPGEEQEEHEQFLLVVSAFLFYRTHALQHYHREKLEEFDHLPIAHQELLRDAGYLVKLLKTEHAIRANSQFLAAIVREQGIDLTPQASTEQTAAEGTLAPPSSESWLQGFVDSATGEATGVVDQVCRMLRDNQREGRPPVPDFHMDKLRSTLRQLVRDWSAEGKAEREASYGPILDTLENLFPRSSPGISGDAVVPRNQRRILVPGAGLGRLALEIAARGFSCQGNEFSFYMLFVSNFILNKSGVTNQYTLYPFIHTFSNSLSADHQVRSVQVPDVLPSDLVPADVDFSMSAGDFIEVYGQDSREYGSWDSVVTCFFVDTATNIIEYLTIIHRLLKPNGVWINLGPLLYHFEHMANEHSIELTLEEVIHVARKVGFRIEKKEDMAYVM
ncbi:hypothetical protein IWQ62_003256 [Dispira parvispora]|uniref:carnosine N-methyltransferase n=1 Tax=Dispira parvispora TaxID=1520584 RepID=A0A9W8APQ8_9FUNG|nr:hypothetical protein IWQ62_003256 [Dispira parvispora]